MASGDKPLAAELERLREAREDGVPWRAWGPYLSERQWGTVREDYSANGDAWGYFTHDQARSRAYHWGEDGLAGIADDHLHLCFAVALWNGKDPILKERVFGLTNREGNHGEDPKEYYHYLDATPTNSYLHYLYRYPQAAFPYEDLVKTNAGRGRNAFEYELIDTGVFDDDRYFDVEVEYAKATPSDIGIRITVTNRGPDPATLTVLPTLWFRNAWWRDHTAERPVIAVSASRAGQPLVASHPKLGEWSLAYSGGEPLFTDNETGPKDAFHRYVVNGDESAVKVAKTGTKAAILQRIDVGPGESHSIRLRLAAAGGEVTPGLAEVDALIERRRDEADEFYRSVIPASLSDDEKLVMRQALAGMIWSKQYYEYDVHRWLAEHGVDPFDPLTRSRAPRNTGWQHLANSDVISMPDKWEYPWYAAWDLAFHVLALTLVDSDFAKGQLELLLRAHYQHPNGQVPAYEWNFGDVNPPVHAWATIFTYRLEEMHTGKGDVEWLERMFQSLVLNFTWWVNRKDLAGNNLFEGGFLGLDNIGVFDRSSPLPTGGYLEQADGTAWMALFCQNMLEISIALSLERPAYGEIAAKFLDHFLRIATAVMHAGADTGMWDEEDGFFYDILRLPDGTAQRLKVRSIVGLLPLCAATAFTGELAAAQPELAARIRDALIDRHELRDFIHDPAKQGVKGRRLTSLLDETKLRRVLARMLDENEFLSEYGIRSLSRFHADHPYVFEAGGQEYRVAYQPAESDSGMFGGNSNWRGPVWMPINALIIRALLQYHSYYGDDFKIECPTGSGRQMTLYGVAQEIGRRLGAIFLLDENGHRPVFGGAAKFQDDPGWRDALLFYEYFHGDNGAGLGAGHQTGWTGVIARVRCICSRRPARKRSRNRAWPRSTTT